MNSLMPNRYGQPAVRRMTRRENNLASQIRQQMDAWHLPPESVDGWLTDRGAESIDDLTQAQAQTLLTVVLPSLKRQCDELPAHEDDIAAYLNMCAAIEIAPKPTRGITRIELRERVMDARNEAFNRSLKNADPAEMEREYHEREGSTRLT